VTTLHVPCALLIGGEGSTALLLALALIVLLALRRLLPERALARFQGQRWSYWHTAQNGFWGRLEPRAAGFVLAFDQPYALPGEPRRSALVESPADAAAALGLVRAHADGRPFDELVRQDLVRRRARPAAGRDVWSDVAAAGRALLDGLDTLAERAFGARARLPLQDGWLLERWRGEHVVLELASGARFGGLLVEIGRAHLALVAPGSAPRSLCASGSAPLDGPLELAFEDGAVVVSATTAPVHVERLADSQRTLALDVTFLPGTRLRLPWASARDGTAPSNFVATATTGFGFDLIAPRASARVVFGGSPPAASASPSVPPAPPSPSSASPEA
jgi:hypothetical protein